MGGRKISSKAKKWIDRVITHEPKTISKILDDLFMLIDLDNKTPFLYTKKTGYTGGRDLIPTTRELQSYLSRKYESIAIKNTYNPVFALHNNKKVKHYFRKEE
tara:strand:- start:300 stop:608 length:309 start_codon:yes stop_codon:yes gene_type:complete